MQNAELRMQNEGMSYAQDKNNSAFCIQHSALSSAGSAQKNRPGYSQDGAPRALFGNLYGYLPEADTI